MSAGAYRESVGKHLLPIVGAVICLQLLLGINLLAETFVSLGWRVPTQDIFSDYLFASVIANAFVAVFFLLPIPFEHKKLLAISWCVRCAVALGASLYYESWYGLDAYSYFASAEGQTVYDLFKVTGYGAGNENVIFLIKFFSEYLSGYSYHGSKIIFALFGHLSAYFFYRSFLIFNRGIESKTAFWLLACFPSTIFWSSILGKDPLVLLGLSTYAVGLAYLTHRKFGKGLIYLTIGLVLASLIRYWLLPLFLMPVFVLFPLLFCRKALGRFTLWFASALLAMIAVPFVFKQIGIFSAQDLIAFINRFSRAWARGGSSQTLPEFASIGELILFFPVGSFTALFRPLPGEVMNPFGIAAGLENLLLFFMAILAVWRGFFASSQQQKVSMLILLVTIVGWSVVYGFVSYQNLGTAFRFRAQITPFLLIFFSLSATKCLRSSRQAAP